MEKRLSEVEKKKAASKGDPEKHSSEILALAQAQKQMGDQLFGMQQKIDSIAKENAELPVRIAPVLEAKLQSFENRFAQILQGMIAETRSGQTSSEAKMQSQQRSMVEKVRDEIAGQIREIERDQVRKPDFDQFVQLTLDRLQKIEVALSQYDDILSALVLRPDKNVSPAQDGAAQSVQKTNEKKPEFTEQERRLMETMGEITKFRKRFGSK